MKLYRCDRCQQIVEESNEVYIRTGIVESMHDLCPKCAKILLDSVKPITDFMADECHFCHRPIKKKP